MTNTIYRKLHLLEYVDFSISIFHWSDGLSQLHSAWLPNNKIEYPLRPYQLSALSSVGKAIYEEVYDFD